MWGGGGGRFGPFPAGRGLRGINRQNRQGTVVKVINHASRYMRRGSRGWALGRTPTPGAEFLHLKCTIQ